MEDLAGDLDLDRGLGQQLPAGPLLDEHGEVDDPEGGAVARRVAPDQQLERCLGALEGEAVGLELLDQHGQLARVDRAVEAMAELLGPELGVGPPAELADHEPALVADADRVDVLVAPLHLGDRRAVDPALVGERRPADVGLVVVRGDIGDLGHAPRQLGQVGQPAAAGRQEAEIGLERQVGQDADHVGIAAALAVAIDRGLHVADAGLHGGDRVGDGQLGVVVGVDPPAHGGRVSIGAERVDRVPDDPHELAGQGSAVRVAQDDRAGAGLPGGTQGGQGVVTVGGVAVEEVLGVVDHLAATVRHEPDRLGDHVQVLGRGGAQDLDHVEQPALAEDRDDRRLGRDQLVQVGVLLRPVRAVPG